MDLHRVVLSSYFGDSQGYPFVSTQWLYQNKKDTKGMPPAVNAMYLMINARLI